VHHRHSLRFDLWDYRAPAAYFVTIVTHGRARLFGSIVDGAVNLSVLGRVARDEWLRSAALRPDLELDQFVVMPNHIHGLVLLLPVEPMPDLPQTGGRLLSRSLGALVGGFKSASSRRINEQRRRPGQPVWQRNYHDRIVRNEDELDAVRAYIFENPSWWSQDPENPDCPAKGEARLAPTFPGPIKLRPRAGPLP